MHCKKNRTDMGYFALDLSMHKVFGTVVAFQWLDSEPVAARETHAFTCGRVDCGDANSLSACGIERALPDQLRW
jgi:hypothetical protein